MVLFKNKRGSAEAISFIFTVAVLMLVVINMVPPVLDMIRYFTMTRVHREAMLRMEAAGGLTPEIAEKAQAELVEAGFDADGITIEGTWGPVDYGETVDLEIKYEYTYREYALNKILITPVDKPRTMAVTGSSVSFTYTK